MVHGRPRSAQGDKIFPMNGAILEINRAVNRRTRRGRSARKARIHSRWERLEAAAHRGASRAGPIAASKSVSPYRIRVYRSLSRLPVRSGRGGENEAHGATRTVGPGSDGERTAGWRAAAGEIGGLE